MNRTSPEKGGSSFEVNYSSMLSHFEIDERRLIATLPPRQIEAVFHVHAMGRTLAEAAEQMSCTASTVQVHLFRAHVRLKKKIHAMS